MIESERLRRPLVTIRTILRIAEELKTADALVSNQSKGHIYGGLAARLTGVTEIWWQQQHASRNAIDLVAAALPTDAIVCSSQAALEAQRRLTPARRIETIHLGTAVDRLAKFKGSGDDIRRRMNWGAAPLVGIVGRLQEWKGQDVFIRAASHIASKLPEVRFVVVGGAILGWEGDYPDRLRRLARELGIGDRTHFVGHQREVYPWFDALDVVVHASYGEPFDHVLIESMALGKPLVATSKGGTAAIVEDGVSGLIVQPGDDLGMAGAIMRLLTSKTLAASIGKEAQNRVGRFSEERMTEEFALLLKELIGKRASRTFKFSPERQHEEGMEKRPVFKSDTMAAPMTHEVCEQLLDDSAPGPVIDAGAGQGAFSERLYLLGHEVRALGIAPEQFLMLSRVPYVKCDIEEGLPIAAESLRGIVAIELIEHLEAPFRLFREAQRCLKKDGFFLLTTPNVLSLAGKISLILRNHMIFFGDEDFRLNGHISPLTLVEIRRMASVSGFRIEKVTYNAGKLPLPKIRHLWPLTAPSFRTQFWGEILVVKLRKETNVTISRPRG
ncbi:MAG: glycosyltransferase [Actinomycetota bacterium]